MLNTKTGFKDEEKMEQKQDQAVLIRENFNSISHELSKVIVGHGNLIRDIFICLICGGHTLIEGVPGLGKTLMVKTLSQILGLAYSRIQFTPDLMPADILGTNMVTEDEKGKRYFEFIKGPVFGQIVLADEINRATPKTQSALLEAMQESKVTIFGKSHTLKKPFMVLATQNPLEMEGTYPLPEAQIDRFFYKLIVNFPNHDELSEIIKKTTEDYKPELFSPVSRDTILLMKKTVKHVPVASHVRDFAIRLLLGSHPDQDISPEKVKTFIRFGASPRGLQTLIMAGKVMALLDGRFSVSTDDIKEVAKPALRHRIILNLKGEAEGIDPDSLIEEMINEL